MDTPVPLSSCGAQRRGRSGFLLPRGSHSAEAHPLSDKSLPSDGAHRRGRFGFLLLSILTERPAPFPYGDDVVAAVVRGVASPVGGRPPRADHTPLETSRCLRPALTDAAGSASFFPRPSLNAWPYSVMDKPLPSSSAHRRGRFGFLLRSELRRRPGDTMMSTRRFVAFLAGTVRACSHVRPRRRAHHPGPAPIETRRCLRPALTDATGSASLSVCASETPGLCSHIDKSSSPSSPPGGPPPPSADGHRARSLLSRGEGRRAALTDVAGSASFFAPS